MKTVAIVLYLPPFRTIISISKSPPIIQINIVATTNVKTEFAKLDVPALDANPLNPSANAIRLY